MTANRRIILNIVATYWRSLYALVIGLFCGRWALMALGEADCGLMVGRSAVKFVPLRLTVSLRLYRLGLTL